jgi:RNA polymerase sigma-B factor
MYRGGEPLEDLEQVACEMLVCAVDRFEPARGIPFRGYARVVIIGALKRHYRDHGWSMRVPRAVHDQLPGVAAASESLQQELGRAPTQSEVAERAKVGRDVLRTISQATDARRVTSLDAPALGGDQAMGDRYGKPDKGFDRIENHLDLQDAMADLPQSDIRVLREYYVDECSQSVIAERRGVSQMQISRRLSRIAARLRTSMAAAG